MSRPLFAVLLSGVLLVADARAESRPAQVLPVIPTSYVSPGASGSIEISGRYQRQVPLGVQPSPPGSLRQEYRDGRYSLESRGGIRQSIEYPGGYELQRHPGQQNWQRQARR